MGTVDPLTGVQAASARTSATAMPWPTSRTISVWRGESTSYVYQIIGMDKALKAVTDLPKQVRFATASAINTTLKEVQSQTVSELLPSKFTLRAKGAPWQRPGTKFGFNIRPFAKRENLTGTLGSSAPWLELQERGGTKTIPGHRNPIPTPALKPKEAITTRQLKPSYLLRFSGKPRRTGRSRARVVATPRPFKSDGQGRLPAGVYVRDGDRLKALYFFKPSVKIDPVLGFEKWAYQEAARRFPKNFNAAFARALATAR